MSTRMTSARFVGRAAELAELQAALEEAAESRPSLALVGGESGVGKSRLADELIRHARESGARVLSGDCVELGEDELPYAPLLTALRPLVRDGDPALDELAPPLRSALDAILPGLGERGAGRRRAAVARLRGAAQPARLARARTRPSLLVVEDLHWADSSTRSFIGFLARTICSERLLVLGTYRSDELHRRHPLGRCSPSWRATRTRACSSCRASRRRSCAEQLEGILADRPDPELVERLYARSEGNALYAEEILAAGLDGRGALPPTLRDALMLRVERLSPRAQELLPLARLPARRRPRARRGGRRARARRAARRAPRGGGEPHRRHGRRRELRLPPRAAARGRLRRPAAGRAHRDARGARGARSSNGSRAGSRARTSPPRPRTTGPRPATSRRALAAAVRAALAAERVNAFGEAQALFERALGLWERVDDPERLAGIEQVELLRHAAVAADQAGDPARQEALLRRALELVDAGTDPERAALIHERLSQSLWSQHRQDDSLEELRGASRCCPRRADARRAQAARAACEAAHGPVALRRGG